MGLQLLGRGNVSAAIRIGFIHILGAALGGAGTGLIFGWLGAQLTIDLHRSWLIFLLAVAALAYSLSSNPVALGRQCQVPRRWIHEIPSTPRYFLWGILLGSGIATPVPYSAFFLFIGMQMTGGALLGGVCGALFGATREAVMLCPLLFSRVGHNPGQLMELLPSLRPLWQRLNRVAIIMGSLLLLFTR
jgi:hypothetical protein